MKTISIIIISAVFIVITLESIGLAMFGVVNKETTEELLKIETGDKILSPYRITNKQMNVGNKWLASNPPSIVFKYWIENEGLIVRGSKLSKKIDTWFEYYYSDREPGSSLLEELKNR